MREVLARMEPTALPVAVPSLAAAPAAPKASAPGADLPHEIQCQDLLLTLGEWVYRVRGWQKPLSPEILKVNLMVTRNARFHVDTLALYQAKERAAFIRQASLELGEAEDRLKLELGKVLRQVEALQADQLAQALAVRNARPALSEAEHAEALALLQAPDLMARILRDFAELGIVGKNPMNSGQDSAFISRNARSPGLPGGIKRLQ